MAKTAVKKSNQQALIGQNRIRELIAESCRTDRIAHAYLLTGPRGVGKTAIALEFGRLLLCQGETAPPCGQCEQCRLSIPLRHPDLHLVFPLPPEKKSGKEEKDDSDNDDSLSTASQQNTLIEGLARDPYTPTILEPPKGRKDGRTPRLQEQIIKIGQIRAILRLASLKPFQASRKVFILFHADAMNTNAQNAFLKALEEPPNSAYFLLTTENERLLRPTVRSRCQRIAVPPLLPSEICAALESEGIASERAQTAADLSGGSFTHARELATGDLENLQMRAIDFLKAAATCDPLKLPDAAEAFLETDAMPSETTLELLAMFLRDAALFRTQGRSGGVPLTFRSSETTIEGVLIAFPQADLEAAARALDESAMYLARGYTESFVLFALAIRLRHHLGPRASSKRKTPTHA